MIRIFLLHIPSLKTEIFTEEDILLEDNLREVTNSHLREATNIQEVVPPLIDDPFIEEPLHHEEVLEEVVLATSNDAKRLGGRLLLFAREWKDACSWSQRIVSKGISLSWDGERPILSQPQIWKTPQKSSGLIQEFLEQGVIYPVKNQKCFQSTVFTVDKANGKLRLILNLKKLNFHLKTPSFKMCNHLTLMKLLPKDAWMISLDIKDAYLHVPIHPNFQKFFAFTVQDQLYFFRAMPFGLTSAPYIFSRLMKHPLKLFREKGIMVLAYLDDLIIWADSKIAALNARTFVLNTLMRLGFRINFLKSNLVPTQNLNWLGMNWTTNPPEVGLTEDYKKKVLSHIQEIELAPLITRRYLEEIQGMLSFSAQILPFGRLNMRLLTNMISKIPVGKRDHLVTRPLLLEDALHWWKAPENLEARTPISPPETDVFLWTDASNYGYGANTDQGGSLRGIWNQDQKLLHINAQELLAVVIALQSDLIPSNSTVALSLDNTPAFFCIKNQGSSKSTTLQEISERLFEIIRDKNLRVSPSHLQGLRNVVADALSREGPSPTEWELQPDSFKEIQSRLPFLLEVDAMATHLNKKLPAFICPFPHPQAAGVDFFLTNLNQWRSLYLFPPVKIISRVLLKLNNFKGHGVIIAPWNASQPWFPLLNKLANKNFLLTLPPMQKIGEEVYTHHIQSSCPYHVWIF